MMKTQDITIDTRCALDEMGVPQNILDRITATKDLETDGRGDTRCTISLGYPVRKSGFTRLKDTAVTNTTDAGLADMLDDRVKVATFLQMGMNATPAANRLELPAWVLELSQAAKKEADMGRAGSLARGAIED
tara:strand:- start:107 stop:505 length:399 start_codon:yes stop_codon:yes gene_type:complete